VTGPALDITAAVTEFLRSMRTTAGDPKVRFETRIAEDLLAQLAGELAHGSELRESRSLALGRAGYTDENELTRAIRDRGGDREEQLALLLGLLGAELSVFRPRFIRRRDIP